MLDRAGGPARQLMPSAFPTVVYVPDMNVVNFQQLEHHRIIGDRTGDAGPVVVFVGGVHGNERSGVVALQQVFGELHDSEYQLQGRCIGLAGNLPALSQKKRFISTDLNRIWTRQQRNEFLAAGCAQRAGPDRDCPAEFFEQEALLRVFEPLLAGDDPVIFVDLHTTSSHSTPFIAINDQLANREFAFNFPVTKILGIEEYLEGTMLNLINEYGRIAIAFEAGQHDDPDSVAMHVAFIYSVLEAAGLLRRNQIRQFEHYQSKLRQSCKDFNRVYEIVYRKPVEPDDQFRMNPGFNNLDRLKKNQVVAHDRYGPVTAPRSGLVFMPLYQSTGDDGFFIVRPVGQWALSLSRILRKINFERVLLRLPGVNRAPGQTDALLVDQRIARFLATELFHLLGYRRKQINDRQQLLFSRREITAHET